MPGTYSSFEKAPYYVIASGDSYDSVDIFSYKSKSIKVDISGAPFKGFMVTAIDPHTGNSLGLLMLKSILQINYQQTPKFRQTNWLIQCGKGHLQTACLLCHNPFG